MPKIKCPTCKATLNAPNVVLGRTVKCPACATRFNAPAPVVVAARTPAPPRAAPSPNHRPDVPLQTHHHHHQPDQTDAPGVISLIFGVLSLLCLFMGCFTCGITYIAAIPMSGIGAGVGFLGKGNLRVAGLVLNILTLIPAVIISMFMLIVMAIGTAGGALESAKATERDKPRPPATDKEEVTYTDASAGKPIRVGLVEVSVKDIGRGDSFDRDVEGRPYPLRIYVEVRNTSDARKVEFTAFCRHGIKLKDDAGNTYDYLNIAPLGARTLLPPNPRTPEAHFHTDMLVCQEPVANARYLLLELDAEAVEGSGKIRFKIPTTMIKR